MKRFKIAALSAVLSALLLTGCHGAEAQGAFEIPDSFDENNKIEITFWAKNDTNVVQSRIYSQAIEDFEKLYPNIMVNLRLYTDYGKIEYALREKDLPILNTNYDAAVTIESVIPLDLVDEFTKAIGDKTAGRAVLSWDEPIKYDVLDGKLLRF